MPADTVILASNAACGVQAMRYVEHAYGFQFHCEIEGTTVADWRCVPAYDESLQTALGSEGVRTLDADVAAVLTGFNANAEVLSRNITRIVERAGKRKPSG